MGQEPRDDLKRAGNVEREVNQLRLRTQSLVEELERRIRARMGGARGTMARLKRAADVRAQLREHRGLVISIGAGTVLAVGVGAWLYVERRKVRARPLERFKRRMAALRLLMAHPEQALRAREPLGRRLLSALVLTVSTVVVRRLAERLSAPLAAPRERRRLPAHE